MSQLQLTAGEGPPFRLVVFMAPILRPDTSQPNSIRMRPVEQPSLPLGRVSADEIARKRSFGDAIGLSAEVAGYDLDKQASADIAMDKGQWSRIQSGQEGIKWAKLEKFLDCMGNDIPLLWMLFQRGYDLHSLRKRETETEQKLREVQEALQRERTERQAIEGAMRRMLVGAAS